VVIKDETLKELKDVKELAALPELRQDNLVIPKESKETKEEKSAESKVVEKKAEEPKRNGRQEPPVPMEQEMKKVTVEDKRKLEEDKRRSEEESKKKEEEEKRVLEELRKKEEEIRVLEELKRKKEEEKRVIEELRKKEEEEKRGLEESRKKEEEKKRALEESRKNKELEEKKVVEPLKVMDVKTGQLSDIKKLDTLRSENEVLPEMKKPLELAARNLTVPEEKKAPENTSFKEQMMKGIPLPVAASNLLKVEERGKRDLEEVEKLDKVSEECPQNETKAEAEPSLIKSPTYLSDPKPILDSAAPKLEPPLLGGPVPRKRDLKSVQPQKKSSEDHK
jgi:hypothetical protein